MIYFFTVKFWKLTFIFNFPFLGRGFLTHLLLHFIWMCRFMYNRDNMIWFKRSPMCVVHISISWKSGSTMPLMRGRTLLLQSGYTDQILVCMTEARPIISTIPDHCLSLHVTRASFSIALTGSLIMLASSLSIIEKKCYCCYMLFPDSLWLSII